MERTGKFRFWALAGVVLSVASLATPVRAQDPDDARRGVARISLINGEVSVRRGDSGDWVAGVINAPLMTADNIATGANSRAEVQFDASNVLRVGANAEIRLADLEYNRYQMELARGVVTIRMLRNTDVDIELDTPSVSVRPSRQGSYRVSVNDAGETEVTARAGDVEVFTPRGSQWVRSGQTMIARGAASDPEFQIVAAGGMDEWDRWCDGRDRMILQSNSSRYVPSGVYGAEDLDNYGNWVSVPDYGNVWQPTVAPGWAPYSYGRWVWGDWYGWTWLSYDPWGWAPYHYGRWFHHAHYGWCWYPGVMGVHHYWSPALVGWFGFGAGGVGGGFGFGNVGWVPLAPYETYHPWWGRGYYGHPYNQTNVAVTNINVNNVYRNARAPNGVTAVGVHDFQYGKFTNVARLNGAQVGTAGEVRGAMPFTPTAGNTRFTDRQATAIPRTNMANMQFFRHSEASPAPRMSINGTPQNITRGGEPAGTFRRFGNPSGQAAPSVNAPQRNGFGASAQSPAAVERPAPRLSAPQGSQTNQPAPRTDNRGGWSRFGSPGNSGNGAPAGNRRQFQQAPQSNSGGGGSNRQEPLRIAPPVVRERPNTPSYSAPRQSAPSYSAPARPSAPSYSAPARPSAPSYSAPRGGGGGGGGNRPSGGGGGGHAGGGGHGGGRR